MRPTKDGLALALSQLDGEELPFVVTADLLQPLGLQEFATNHEDLFFNVGVAEQAMVGIASGLAASGRPAIAATFATFLLRACEQIRNLLVIDHRHVVLVGSHAGIVTGPNGVTHQSLEDVGILNSLGLSIWSPCSADEASAAIKHALSEPGPHYVRLVRYSPPISTSLPCAAPTVAFDVDGPHVTVVSHGVMTPIATVAASLVAPEGHKVRVIHVPRLAPFPFTQLRPLLAGRIMSIEDHFPATGLGAMLQVALMQGGIPQSVFMVGPQTLMGSDDAEVLLQFARLDAQSLAKRICEIIP